MHKHYTADDRAALRAAFNGDAQLYDAMRPDYPQALIEAVIALAALPPNGRILEIGCGTGQATLPFAQRGYAITCVELGAELAAVAQAKFRSYPNVEIINMAFEAWPPQPEAFDLVMAATAFHWLPPEIGYPKAAQMLKADGSLAIFSNEHPKPYAGFFVDVQQVYRQVVPEWEDARDTPPIEANLQKTVAYIDGTGLFEPVVTRTYPWTQIYTAAEYVKLLDTYSNHRLLDPSRKTELYNGVGALIENEYGGMITKEYVAVLYVARKR